MAVTSNTYTRQATSTTVIKNVSEYKFTANNYIHSVSSESKDTTPPNFTLADLAEGSKFLNNKPFVIFKAVDTLSGVSHYETLKKGEWVAVTSPYLIDESLSGSEIIIKAVDKQGNSTKVSIVQKAPSKSVLRTVYTSVVSSTSRLVDGIVNFLRNLF